MIIKYLIYNGEDFGSLPNSLEVNLILKEQETGGYSELRLKWPYSLNEKKNADLEINLPKFQKSGICSVLVENGPNFFLFLDYIIKSVGYGEAILTSKQYVDFQPIIKLGAQL